MSLLKLIKHHFHNPDGWMNCLRITSKVLHKVYDTLVRYYTDVCFSFKALSCHNRVLFIYNKYNMRQHNVHYTGHPYNSIHYKNINMNNRIKTVKFNSHLLNKYNNLQTALWYLHFLCNYGCNVYNNGFINHEHFFLNDSFKEKAPKISWMGLRQLRHICIFLAMFPSKVAN